MTLSDLVGLIGILVGLGLLIWLAFKGWSVLLLAALAAGVFSREPLLAHWTQTFMRRRRILRSVLPALLARCPVRHADGGQRLGHSDRRLHDPQLRANRVIPCPAVAISKTNDFVPIYYLRNRYYAYRWRGAHYHHQAFRNARWRYW
jgi:hypothetical protein